MKSLSCIFVIMLGLSLCYGIGDVIPKFQCVDTVDPYVWVYWAIENCDNNSVTYHYTLSSGAGATLESGTKTAVAGWNTGANGFWVPKYTSFHYAPTPWTLSTYGPSGVVYSSSWNGCLEPGASSSTCGYPAGNECYLDGRYTNPPPCPSNTTVAPTPQPPTTTPPPITCPGTCTCNCPSKKRSFW